MSYVIGWDGTLPIYKGDIFTRFEYDISEAVHQFVVKLFAHKKLFLFCILLCSHYWLLEEHATDAYSMKCMMVVFWQSAHSSKSLGQNGPSIFTAPGREGCFRSDASHQPLKRVSPCDAMIDEGLNGAEQKRKAREEMPPKARPLGSNKCTTKWPLNIVEAMWVSLCVCAHEQSPLEITVFPSMQFMCVSISASLSLSVWECMWGYVIGWR